MSIKAGQFIKLYKIRPDLKICWFAITRAGQKFAAQKIFLMFIPEKKIFNHEYIINYD